MFGVFSLATKTLTSPLWLPWKAYKGLWWAFDVQPKPARPIRKGSPTPAVETPVAGLGKPSGGHQQASFEVVDSSPPARPLPVKSLRAGYAATYLMSAMTGGIVAGLASDGEIATSRAWVIWAWVTGTLAVASLLVVRRMARREIARLEMRRKIFGAPKAAAKAAAAGVAACCAKAQCAAQAAMKGDSARAAAKWFAGSGSGTPRAAWGVACGAACKAGKAAKERVKADGPGWKAKLAPYFTGRWVTAAGTPDGTAR